jgi:hypothetical protein
MDLSATPEIDMSKADKELDLSESEEGLNFENREMEKFSFQKILQN